MSNSSRKSQVKCPHISDSVNFEKLKTVILNTGFLSTCAKCGNNCAKQGVGSMCICLTCGNQACSRLRNKHALQHYKNVSHAICLNTRTWTMWCYKCEKHVDVPSKNKKVVDTLDYLRMAKERSLLASKFEELSAKKDHAASEIDCHPHPDCVYRMRAEAELQMVNMDLRILTKEIENMKAKVSEKEQAWETHKKFLQKENYLLR